MLKDYTPCTQLTVTKHVHLKLYKVLQEFLVANSSEQESAVDQSNAETSSLCSLEHLRLSDFESNAAFRRDKPGRISITKKSESPCRGG